MAGTTLRLVDGTAEVRLAVAGTNYDSPYRCKSYDLGFPDPRVVSADSAGVSGVTDLTTLHGARTVALSLSVWNDANGTKHHYLDLLRGMCRPSNRPWLYAQCEGWDQERRIALRASPLTCVVGQPNVEYVEASLSFSAPSGLFEALDPVTDGPAYPQAGAGFSLVPGNAGSAALSLTPGDAGSSALSLAVGSGANQLAITNVGSAPAAPTFVIAGPTTSPQIINHTAGVRLAFTDYTIPSGHFVVIDVGRRVVLFDGDATQNAYNHVDWSVSRWFLLAPGLNTLEFASGDDGGGGQLTVQHSPRFF